MAIRSPEFMASTIASNEAFENKVSRTFLMASRMLNNMSTKPESSANGLLVKLPLNRISITWLLRLRLLRIRTNFGQCFMQ